MTDTQKQTTLTQVWHEALRVLWVTVGGVEEDNWLNVLSQGRRDSSLL